MKKRKKQVTRPVEREKARRSTAPVAQKAASPGQTQVSAERADRNFRSLLAMQQNLGNRAVQRMLKRAIKGTYIHVAPFHLERYCDEQSFRYRVRKKSEADRFDAALSGAIGKRLTYRALCAINDAGFMGIQ